MATNENRLYRVYVQARNVNLSFVKRNDDYDLIDTLKISNHMSKSDLIAQLKTLTAALEATNCNVFVME